ncbi:MAG: hypothetical protein HC769_19860 [Cyanobacteria bacterium CRU_2_1]|nr:hypothetical protein [Cyanobacteria bacterium RU_5_0]NJR60877.1 hypothetical protein [Cyanobacteria bacterium CRU_2_1]
MRSILLSDLKHSPFSLVTFAYQAGLRSQGIPGWKSLITAHQRQQVSGLDLVQKAVEANLLPAQLLNNQEYINAVDNGIYFYYLKHPESNTVSFIDKVWTTLSYLADRILMYSQLGLSSRRAYQGNKIPKDSCTQSINLKTQPINLEQLNLEQQWELEQNWQTFDRQIFMLRSRF